MSGQWASRIATSGSSRRTPTSHGNPMKRSGAPVDPSLRILVVDDEMLMRETLEIWFEDSPHQVTTVATGDQARNALTRDSYDLVLLDLRLGGESGLDLIPRLREGSPRTKFVLMTAHGSVDSAVAAMRMGVLEYLQKPLATDAIQRILSNVQQLQSLEGPIQVGRLEDLIGAAPLLDSESSAMREALALAETVASTDATVLLRGESGTGKGVLARAIHRTSRRSRNTFSVVNCPSLSEELLNSELFGHVRGAFTGAVQNNQGMISYTEGGTLFLDEIGELPLSLQPKLLRFLQDREYQRVGDARTYSANVRVIAATNAPLERALQQGTFRQDLYHRLNVFPIDIPPLRERREDIPRFAHLFLAAFSHRHGKKITGISDQAVQLLIEQTWPGNVRELQNTVERAVILARSDLIDVHDLNVRGNSTVSIVEDVEIADMPTLDEMEKRYISFVLDRADTIERAAEILDISTPTLWRRRRKHGL